MILLAKVAARNLIAFGFLLFLTQMAAHEIAFRIGRVCVKRREVPSDSVGLLVGGALGLLSFVLALSLSFSSNSFYERRASTLAEANAISTAWLRAGAIGEPQTDDIARLLKQYTTIRIAFIGANNDPTVLDDLNKQTNILQSSMWRDVSVLVRKQPHALMVSLMNSLNDVFDKTTSERFAFDRQVSPQVLVLLIGLAVLGMSMLGYQLAINGSRMPLLAALLTLTWTVVIVDIVDLASARLGDLRTSVTPYEWTLQGFQAGVIIEPASTR